MATKQITVVPYDAAWPKIFELEAANIKEAFGDNCVDVIHVGSTSVPGLLAKPIIDIIAVVKDLKLSLNIMEKFEYVCKGELNIPLRYFYSKNMPEPKVNLHVVEEDNGFIEWNLCFRDYLRSHSEADQDYANLKKEILKDSNTFEVINGQFTDYTFQKHHFINDTLNKAGFDGVTINFCLHEREWEEYHRIKEEQLFSVRNIPYDRNHPCMKAENNFHFVLYKGTKIVSVAQVEFLDKDEAAIRGLATDAPYQKQGFGSHLIKFIEKWIKHHDRYVIHMHAALGAEHFYRTLGYMDMKFEDPTRPADMNSNGKLWIDLGKTI